MASDYEDGILDDVDAICGWGAADFDDEFESQSRRKAVKKVTTKPKPQKTLSNLTPHSYLKAASGLVTLCNATDSRLSQEKQLEKPIESLLKQSQPHRKAKLQHHQKPKDHLSTEPSPRTLSLKEENAAIAASGRERRKKIVAAAMASNVPRKPGIGSVVSASFDGNFEEEQEGVDMMPRRKPDEWMPSSAPHKQLQEKLPRVSEPSTAPVGVVQLPKKLVPLPLLSIQPGCGGNETRLFGTKDAPPAEARRHRQHKYKPSLLPSRDASDTWESNFPPALRRFRSPRKHKAEIPQTSSSSVSSLTKDARPPPAPQQEYSTPIRLKESLPLLHPSTCTKSDAASAQISNTSVATLNNVRVARRDTKYGEDDEDESWTKCYDDPEVLANSMAGLIQALSTFAADGKQLKSSKTGKNKRRRAKLQQQASSNPPALRLPRPKETAFTSDRSPITEVPEPIARRRKHRKLRTSHDPKGPQR